MWILYIADELAAKLVPQSGQIRAALELVSREFTSSRDGAPAAKQRRCRLSTAEEKEEDLLPQLKPLPGTEIRFTNLPERNFPEGATPAEITHHSLDSSYALDLMLQNYTRYTSIQGVLILNSQEILIIFLKKQYYPGPQLSEGGKFF